ncbi:hypothetical protein HNR46_003067 [Haloferula luteola]|uniref:Uncharacterized protein n=1 Tax=Haloferula luteola TaxID=595692 RepID=A0A840VG72_9BACT|nr:hypothetical protein [Haloferula luteola]MBB5352819.1 hypothetical protein [Haloferula luteola]
MKPGKIIGFAILAGFLGIFAWSFTREPKRPATQRLKKVDAEIAKIESHSRDRLDADLVRQLAAEHLGDRRFRFGVVMEAASGKKVLPLRPGNPVHDQVCDALRKALDHASEVLSQPDSPVRGLRRINEASRYFENLLLETLDAQPELSVGIPPTTEGRHQRSGYPDLRIEHLPSHTVFYLDPKLVEQGSWSSTLRTFYFEPTGGTLKITEDAVHLLAGIPHDGQDGSWTFGKAKIIDLSTITLRLKPEFQASNADLYSED